MSSYRRDAPEVAERGRSAGRLYDPEELRIGIEVEREHADLVRALRRGGIHDDQKVYEMIAKAHLREIPDYYARLTKMEHDYFKG